MEFIIVCIKDRSIDAFQQVFTVRAQGEAIRGFIDALANENSGNMYRHPDDFDLYMVGTFDDITGNLKPCEPTKIGDGKQLSQKGE